MGQKNGVATRRKRKPIDGRFRLMELEMIEPYLAFDLAPEATAMLATAVATRLL